MHIKEDKSSAIVFILGDDSESRQIARLHVQGYVWDTFQSSPYRSTIYRVTIVKYPKRILAHVTGDLTTFAIVTQNEDDRGCILSHVTVV